jgi:serine/threonine protein phosphatase PrpC
MVHAQAAVLLVPWQRRGTLAAPSCTFVSALWDGETITVGWVGDSRAYWIGASDRLQLTIDHSWAQEQRDAGVDGAALDEHDPRAHSITRWLGADAPELPPQTATFRPAEPGTLLICSDGLWNYLPTVSALAERVQRHPPGATPVDVARALVAYANAAGGHDNVTVAVADVTPGARSRL